MMKFSEMAMQTELLRMVRGYWFPQVLFAAHGLGVFKAIAHGAATSEEIAKVCGSNIQFTDRLLSAGAAIGLLVKKEGRYQNSPMADAFLVPGKEGYLGHWVELMSEFYTVWGGLQKAIHAGKTLETFRLEKGQQQDTETFALAMHEFAIGPGRELAQRIDLTGKCHLLDIGGGAGSYAILLAQRYPELKATVFDMPPVIQIAKRLIAESGLSKRVITMEGDYHCQGFGSGYDAVLLSNILHQEEQATCRKILRHTFDALVPGGMVIIHDIYVNPDGAGPAWPAMQSLLQLLLWGGCVYTVDETMELLTGVGFIGTKVLPLSLLTGGSIITAEKPAS